MRNYARNLTFIYGQYSTRSINNFTTDSEINQYRAACYKCLRSLVGVSRMDRVKNEEMRRREKKKEEEKMFIQMKNI